MQARPLLQEGGLSFALSITCGNARASQVSRRAKAAEYAQGWIYADYRMTVFSASEEKIAEGALLHGKLYFDMPEALEAAGGKVSTNPVDFAPYVVVDRELITGQNPSSDHQLAAQMVEALDRPLADAATP
ncbi:hypothetical protein JMJ56_24180 [Belnapia sp. T18]|uniref:DJ-1/PfpI family protein n=1 Tax=Belnapia arida TaxID=2804533 RepID=A0ABS1U8U3_9PROT|nr:hypothetical protein [Belnapia arida]MBL6081107.1 hypothetical protein [Belnapia arida]